MKNKKLLGCVLLFFTLSVDLVTSRFSKREGTVAKSIHRHVPSNSDASHHRLERDLDQPHDHDATIGEQHDAEQHTDESSNDGHHHATAHWDYDGIYGPMNWTIFNSACSSIRQSPINIAVNRTLLAEDLDRISLAEAPFTGEVSFINNGHTVNFIFDHTIQVVGGKLPGTYKVAGVHFHWGIDKFEGSEHTINGMHYPLEMHIVTYDSDRYDSVASAVSGMDSLAVLGVLFDIAKEDNPAFERVIGHLQDVKIPDKNSNMPDFELSSLLPEDTSSYFRYYGSLTTPPCAESVIWTLFNQHVLISDSQVQQFRELLESSSPDGTTPADPHLDHNWRPVQPLKGRQVLRSFPLPRDHLSKDTLPGSIPTNMGSSKTDAKNSGFSLGEIFKGTLVYALLALTCVLKMNEL